MVSANWRINYNQNFGVYLDGNDKENYEDEVGQIGVDFREQAYKIFHTPGPFLGRFESGSEMG